MFLTGRINISQQSRRNLDLAGVTIQDVLDTHTSDDLGIVDEDVLQMTDPSWPHGATTSVFPIDREFVACVKTYPDLHVTDITICEIGNRKQAHL